MIFFSLCTKKEHIPRISQDIVDIFVAPSFCPSSACACISKVIVINQLLTLRLIEPVNVIQWLFSPGVKSYWERAYPWEVVRMALEGLLSEIMDVFRQLRSLNRDRAKLQREITEDPESFDVADKEKILKKSERRSHNLEQMLREDLVEHLKLVFFELFKVWPGLCTTGLGLGRRIRAHFSNSAPLGGARSPPLPRCRSGQIFFRAFGRSKIFVGAFGAN